MWGLMNFMGWLHRLGEHLKVSAKKLKEMQVNIPTAGKPTFLFAFSIQTYDTGPSDSFHKTSHISDISVSFSSQHLSTFQKGVTDGEFESIYIAIRNLSKPRYLQAISTMSPWHFQPYSFFFLVSASWVPWGLRCHRRPSGWVPGSRKGCCRSSPR